MINLHNHSTWSDGRYTPEQLVQAGVVGGLTHIGISDHFFTQKLVGDGPDSAYVDVEQVEDYVADLRCVGERFAGRIGVLAGIEVDWSRRVGEKLSELLVQIDQFDYVLFEYVEDRDWYGGSLELLCELLPVIPIPVGLAHNHLSRNFGDSTSPEELVSRLAEHELFVELSTNPFTGYYKSSEPYNVRLWEALAESEVRFSVGSDTHGYIEQVAGVRDAHRFLEARGLLERLITARWDMLRQAWSDRPR
jgi:histidinol phosphatase-like PHP family hydrolase